MKNQHWLRPSLISGKPIVFIDMDGVLCDFITRYTEMEKLGFKGPKLWKHPDLYKDLEPINGAIDSWLLLQEKYDTYILSTPPWSSPDAYKEKRIWVEKYLGKTAKKKLILCHNKGIICGDFLIDDRIAHGVADFKGKHIHFGTSQFPDWKSVLLYLNK
jgi:5'(3')-deoxyribonucleotidase